MNHRSTLPMKFIASLVLFFALTLSTFFKANTVRATSESCGWCAGTDQCYTYNQQHSPVIPGNGTSVSSDICGGIHNCCTGYVPAGSNPSPTPGSTECRAPTNWQPYNGEVRCGAAGGCDQPTKGDLCDATGHWMSSDQCVNAHACGYTGTTSCNLDQDCRDAGYTGYKCSCDVPGGIYCVIEVQGSCVPSGNTPTFLGCGSPSGGLGAGDLCANCYQPANANSPRYCVNEQSSCGTNTNCIHNPQSSPTPSGSTPPSSPVPTPPPGKLGYAQANCGGVYGWACDGKDYSKPLFITLYWDVQDQAHYIGKVTAEQPGTAAIAQACGGNANHAFTITYPPGIVPPGQHQIIVVSHALNLSNVSDASLPYYLTDATTAGLTPTIQCAGPSPSPTPTPTPIVVKGYSTNNCNGVFGWACDGQDYSKALNVYAYVDSYDQAHLLNLNVIANQPGDPGITASCGGNSAHVFSFNYPASITQGIHKIWVVGAALNSAGVSDSSKQYLLLDTRTGGVGTIDRSACSSPVASATPPPPVCGGVTCTIAGADQTPAPTKQVTCVMNPLDASVLTPGTTASYEGTCSVVRSGVTFGLPPLVPISASSPQFRPFTLTAGRTTCQFSSCVTRNGIQTCTPWPIPGSQPL